MDSCGFHIGHIFVAASAGVLSDEVFSLREFRLITEKTCAVQVDVRQIKRHRTEFDDLLGFGPLARGGAGQGGSVRR